MLFRSADLVGRRARDLVEAVAMDMEVMEDNLGAGKILLAMAMMVRSMAMAMVGSLVAMVDSSLAMVDSLGAGKMAMVINLEVSTRVRTRLMAGTVEGTTEDDLILVAHLAELRWDEEIRTGGVCWWWLYQLGWRNLCV